MRNRFIILTLLSCLSLATRGQTITDANLSEIIHPPVQAKSLTFWFDTGADRKQTTNELYGAYTIDVSALSDGLHTLHYQVMGVDGKGYGLTSQMFLKMPKNIVESAINPAMLNYWYDTDTSDIQTTSDLSGVYILDVSALSDGLHTLHYQVVGSDGKAYELASDVFLKMTSKINEIFNEVAPVAEKLKYWFNQNVADAVLTDVENGIQTVDVSALSCGLNSLNYQVVYKDGSVSPVASSIFLKQFDALGQGIPNIITKYQYWVNNHFIQTVELENATNPYQLVTLLPVQKMPIRSSSFHFGIENNIPSIYSKNDIYIRFHNARGYFADDSKQYLDYSVKQAVTPVGELQETQTFDKVEENAIRWYTVHAEAGDTLAFKSSQATAIQLFSPSGEELYSASGIQSVDFEGCHTWESGTHYLAVHDVTGNKPSMTLDCVHLDKYDVVDQDVHIVGDGGYNSVLFKGNGFHDLQSVELIHGVETLTSDSIGHESDAETSVRFDFGGATLGDYKAVFHFADDILEIEDCITVEEATPIDLEGSASFASTFIFGRGNTYTFKYHNKSNMTAYDVPLAIYVFTPQYLGDSIADPLTRIKVGGYDLYKHYRELLGEYYTDSLDAVIQAKRALTDDVAFMLNDTVPDYISGYPYARHTYIKSTFHPNETKTFTVHVNTMTDMHVYLWAPIEWDSSRSSGLRQVKRMGEGREGLCRIINSKSYYCEENQRMKNANTPPIYKVDCTNVKPKKNCPPNRPGGGSNGTGSKDPNDIRGYISESGAHFIADSVAKVSYTIEFENDTALATASAHTIVVRDTLDAKVFDRTHFVPTSVKLGGREVFLDEADVTTADGVTSFVKTIDVRPEINAIAQVEGTYSARTGIAEWRFTSLDPMTMEETDDVMQGILPVNFDGTSGIGEVMFEVGVRPGKGDGTEIRNRAGIVFDYEEAIQTPTWVNTVDAVAPESSILGGIQRTDSTLVLRLAGEDNRSGVWKYDVYAQAGDGAPWELVAEGVAANVAEGEAETPCEVRIYDGIEYGFLVLATDSAGNRERKSFEEADFRISTVMQGDANGDGTVDALDVVLVTSYYLGGAVYLNFAAADVNADGEVDALDVVGIQNIYLNATGGKALAKKRQRKHKRD